MFVGHLKNRNWILGNWIVECRKRIPFKSNTLWLPTSFAKKRKVDKLVPKVLRRADAYFFSYPTTFLQYSSNHEVARRSLVLYTHNEQPELGTDEEQVKLLNKSHAVHFFSSVDSARLVSAGLLKEKVRIANGAIDLDLPQEGLPWNEREKIIVIASRFGYRKSPERIPELVRALKDWKFVLLGRGWERFIQNNALNKESNFEYLNFDKESRNHFFPRGRIFLSVSILEGGPIPLLEAIYCGMCPIVSDTGFARDLLGNANTSNIFDIKAENRQIIELIETCKFDSSLQQQIGLKFTWDRIARMICQDMRQIISIESRGREESQS